MKVTTMTINESNDEMRDDAGETSTTDFLDLGDMTNEDHHINNDDGSLAEEGSSRSGIWSNFHAEEDVDTNSASSGVSPNTNPDSNQDSNNTGLSKPESDESLDIANKENLAVRTWRLIMFTVLIVTTITVSVLVYYVVHNSEYAEFTRAFEDNSKKFSESLLSTMDTKLEAVDSLAMLMVTNAREKNQTWPYTTLNDFGPKAAKMRILSHAIALQEYKYVEEYQRADWEAYAKANEAWVQETIDIQRQDTTFQSSSDVPNYDTNQSTSIRYGGPVENNTGPYTPTWQTYPMLPQPETCAYNFNAIQHKTLGPGIERVVKYQKVVIGPVLNFEDSKEASGSNRVNKWSARHVSSDVDHTEPFIRVLYPILDTATGAITAYNTDSKVVGIIASSFFWRSYLENILPDGQNGLVVVFENNFTQTFTYQIDGHEAIWMGPGDLHDPQFDDMREVITFEQIVNNSADSSGGRYGGLPIDTYCPYTVTTYPSEDMTKAYLTGNPTLYMLISMGIFVFTALVFIGYDKLVAMRQKKVMKTAVKSTTIVSSLFPSNVRDRLLEGNGDETAAARSLPGSIFQPTKSRLRTFLNDGDSTTDSTKPIADLFTDTTVLFADIAGFTAWSSVREPTQVFTLLETIYGAFDTIASRRGVFKVETIGDSYVAVCGLPDPRKDHAVVMSKFARDCRQQFNELCSIMESSLGPETGDLNLRIGLHSGPVTAGVLRGQKSRFQLFGDTVNTAARMESTGRVNKIQISQATADLLTKAKKAHWLQARNEKVEAKGKGLMVTYWVEPKNRTGSVSSGTSFTRASSSQEETFVSARVSSQTQRLISWNIDVLERLLKKIVARRIAVKRESNPVEWSKPHKTVIVLDEVKEVIKLPEYDSKYYMAENPDSIILQPRVKFQLGEFVMAIALTYHDNPFHNFPHASHVGMSVAKLLSRIVAPDQDFEKHEQLHDHTYGITSDPLTQFACVFSALIHDADHPGVPNAQLVKEETDMAQIYKGKSIAEQNSINLAWNILIEPKYADLRRTICETQEEEARFRQLVVNAVCATDIIDKDLKSARNKRWEKAFSTNNPTLNLDQDLINRRATIVIEHIIQASDVAHTMQHWHIYIKWNERLYAEMYRAYIEGRADKDPTDTWYKGELGFFDFYIIPLAQKLSECGVFGVSSDEYLNYAKMNRNEWEKKGKDVVDGYEKKYKKEEMLLP
mmetsp:Transcript_31229/g.73559  ORF Transcript_31229/g.73559 Transcript_31229/m.73559 type:complete len:1201 (+) Transcript_31229:149-3751(+)